MNSRVPGVLGVTGVLTVAVGLAVGVTVLPAQRTTVSAAAPLPTSRSTPALVCPGPETLLVPDGGTPVNPGAAVLISALAGSETGAPSAKLQVSGERSSAAESAAQTLPTGLTSASLPVTRGSELDLAGRSGVATGALAVTSLGPALLRTAPARPGSADVPSSLAAVQSTLARSGDLRGLSATSCSVPAADTWLVGGSTAPGARLRLLLANPAATAAVVDVEVRGPKGKVRAASGEGVQVPAGGEVTIFVDALAPGLKQVALHVTARSGRVLATLHDSRLLGLVPGGADDVPVAARPAKRQMIAGISLVNGYGTTADDPSAPGSTAIRIAVPGAEEAVVRVRLLNATGTVELPRAAVVSVPAGGVAELPIFGIPSGTYAAVVDADVPVVAGALIGRSGVPGTAPATEFAWAGAARPLAGSGYLVLPPGARSTLSLVAPSKTGRLAISQVRRDGSAGEPVNVEVKGESSATVQLEPETVAVRIGEVSGGPLGASLVNWVTDPRGSLISVTSVDLAVPATPPTTAVQDHTLGLGRNS